MAPGSALGPWTQPAPSARGAPGCAPPGRLCGGRGAPASSRFRGRILLVRGSSQQSFMFWSKSRELREPGGTFWKLRLASGIRCTSCRPGRTASVHLGGHPPAGADGSAPPARTEGRPHALSAQGSWTPPTPRKAGPGLRASGQLFGEPSRGHTALVTARPLQGVPGAPQGQRGQTWLGSPPHGRRWLRQGWWARRGSGPAPGSPRSPRLQPHRGSPGPGWPRPSPASGSACGNRKEGRCHGVLRSGGRRWGGRGAGACQHPESPAPGRPLPLRCRQEPVPRDNCPVRGRRPPARPRLCPSGHWRC